MKTKQGSLLIELLLILVIIVIGVGVYIAINGDQLVTTSF